MSDERWKTMVSFVQFVLGTVIVGLFGTIINHQIQTREIEIKEQDQITQILKTMLTNNAADKYMMAQFYAIVTRSEDNRSRWELYRDELKKGIEAAKIQSEKAAEDIHQATDSKLIDQKQALMEQIHAIVTPSAISAPPQALPARIYFHIPLESQRGRASDVARQIAIPSELVVPGIQKVAAVPNATELRYFKLADAVEADGYAKTLASHGIATSSKYVPGYESSQKLRPRHYELWISSDWK